MTDVRERQRDLQERLSYALHRKAPEHYDELVKAGKIEDFVHGIAGAV